ncbi:hypothetical protein DPMN_172519 [Dreissena polymorpha]|uniref:Uncharacterized protein n=1 Tax=Dreissena polymorpha TaxID=45954 RepID=A0A9D4IF83_DREPO|nr:hypothetical protein DPMN_172519 [Dreissena polymorpha]
MSERHKSARLRAHQQPLQEGIQHVNENYQAKRLKYRIVRQIQIHANSSALLMHGTPITQIYARQINSESSAPDFYVEKPSNKTIPAQFINKVCVL